MRIVKTFALAALVLVLAAALTPAQAKCDGPAVIVTNSPEGRTFVWNEGTFTPTCTAGFPPYQYAATNAVSNDFFGAFWQLGSGDVTIGLGNDSGTLDALNTADTTQGWFNFYSWATGSYAGEIFADWAVSPAVDGCIGPNVCECVLLTDQYEGVGYFAVIAGTTEPTADFFLTQAGSNCTGVGDGLIVMKPVPEPTITRIDMDMATRNMTFNVTATAPVDGVYNADGCNCGPNGFVVYQAIVDRDAPPPGDRNAAAWQAMTAETAFGDPAVFESACGGTEVDVYLAIGMTYDSGFSGGTYPIHLSANSLKTQCGPTMAEPTDLQPRIRRELRENPRTERKR